MCVVAVSGCQAGLDVFEYVPDILFVHQADVFFGLAECCVGACSKDIEEAFCFCVYVFGVRVESNFSRMSPGVRWACWCRAWVC